MLCNGRVHHYVYNTGCKIQKKAFKNMTINIRRPAARTLATALAVAFAAVAAPATAQQPPGIMLIEGGIPLADSLDELKKTAQRPGATDAQKIAAIGDLFALAQKTMDFQDAIDAVEMLVGLASDNTAATADAALDALMRLANNPRAKLRESVAFHLYKYAPRATDNSRMLAILLRLADDSNPTVRAVAYGTAAHLTEHAAIANPAYDIVIGGTRDTDPHAQRAVLIALQTVAKNMPAVRDASIDILLLHENDEDIETRHTARAKLVMIYKDDKKDHDKIVPMLESIRRDSAHRAATLVSFLILDHDFRQPDIIDLAVRIAEDRSNSASVTATNTLLSAAKKDSTIVPFALRGLPVLLNEKGDEYEVLQNLREIADKFPQHAAAIIDAITTGAYNTKSQNTLYATTIGEIGEADPQAARHALDSLTGLAKNSALNIRRDVGFGLNRLAMAYPAMRDEILGLYADLAANPDYAVAELALQVMQQLALTDSSYAERAERIMMAQLDNPNARIGRLAINTLATTLRNAPTLAPELLDYVEKNIDAASAEMRKGMTYALVELFNLAPQQNYARIVPLLKKIAYDTDYEVRIYAATNIIFVLGSPLCPDTALLPVLRTLTKDTDYRVRAVAEESLEKYAHQQKFIALQNALPTINDVEKQLPAALTDAALAQTVLDNAIAIITAPDTAIQQRTADAIGKIGTAHPALAAQAISALATMNDAHHPSARLFAVQNIGTIGIANGAQAEAAIKALSAFNADTDAAVISRTLAAATIIGKRHHAATDDARDLLAPFTKSKDTTLRRTTEHQLKMLPPAP